MPIGGAIAGIGSALLGGAAGGANTRPPSLDPTQSKVLDQLLPMLFQQVQGNPSIDPTQQSALFDQIARSTTGANNQVTHALTSRGLGQSGILGSALMNNAAQASASQNNVNLGLQQQAVQQRQANIGDILGLLNVGNTPGQSGFGGFLNGLAPVLAYSIQNQQNKNSTSPRDPGMSFPGAIDY